MGDEKVKAIIWDFSRSQKGEWNQGKIDYVYIDSQK